MRGTQEIVNDKRRLIWIALGGSLELLGAQGTTIAFNKAFEAGMNGGILGSIVAMNIVFVILAAQLLFNERLTGSKLFSICLLITSLFLVSLFPPEQ